MLLNRKFIYTILGLQLLGIILAVIFSDTLSADNIEHLRMSFLVSEGYVPYRDFFEHHHPLIWYMFAPVIKALPQDAILIFYVSRILSLFASGLTFYIIYRMFNEFLGNKEAFIYFLLVVFSFFPLWYGVCVFKPDIFMRLFYFAGLYLFFRYIRDGKIKDLLYCGLCFTIAFLFLQTIAFSILPLALPLGYIIYKKTSKLKQLIIAAIPSVLIICGVVFLLIISGTWQAYFDLNWTFNSGMLNLIFNKQTSYLWCFMPFFMITAAVYGWQVKKRTTTLYINIIALLFFSEFAQYCILPVIFPHYLINLLIFSALLTAPILSRITNVIAGRYITAFCVCMFILNSFTLSIHLVGNTLNQLKTVNNDRNEKILHIDYMVDQIYVPLRFYHTLGLDTLGLYNKIFKNNQPFDIENHLKEHNIKYVVFSTQKKSSDFMPKQTEKTPQFLKNYEQLDNELWIRKQ